MLLITDDTLFWNLHARLATLAKERRLPAIGGIGAFAEAGGLMAYGPALRRVPARSLICGQDPQGSQARGPPREQPTKFELIINSGPPRRLG